MTDRKAGTCITLLPVLAVLLALIVGCSADDGGPISAARAKANVGSTQTVCGLAASATYAGSSSGRPTFINLGKPYPDHSLTIVIWGANRRHFSVPPERAYTNQRICVTGLIESFRDRPQITVIRPAQITREDERVLAPATAETRPTSVTLLAPTRLPTNTPLPTATPYPTNTRLPTYTPRPTPTYTLVPTRAPTPRPTPTATTAPPKITVSEKPGLLRPGYYCDYGMETTEYASGTISQVCLKLPLDELQCPEGYEKYDGRRYDGTGRSWVPSYSGWDKAHDTKNFCRRIYIAPTSTPLPYKVSYKTYYYSSPQHGVSNVPVCFEERTHHDDGRTYAQDVTYRTTYKDRQGRTRSLRLTFVLVDRGTRGEYIQAYETSSPGTFDDASSSAITQAFKDIKAGKARPHHEGCR